VIFFNLKLFFLQPSDHKHVLARFTHATAEDIKNAIQVGLEARVKWDQMPLK
jgi:delta 1-pyrroline-5-carboxylate dehydrogenase